MTNTFLPTTNPAQTNEICTRQIALIAAFLLPTGKLLELPSLLSRYAKGDILLPALMQFMAQTLVLLGVLYAASRAKRPLIELLEEKFGKWLFPLFTVYALFYLLAGALPLLDLEKFVYAAFFDTAPTAFSFGLFFLVLPFVCAKGLKSLGRFGDLCLFLFVLPFAALLVMAFFETDLTRLLPFFGTDVEGITQAFQKSSPHFLDALLLTPLILSKPYQEGDGIKITLGYFAGALLTLVFFAAFFGIYSTLAPREHYALSKIAQYFPALDIVGRLDLLFVYLVTAVLLVYTCLPFLYTTELTARLTHTRRKTLFAALLSLFLFIAVLFLNRYYNAFYAYIGGKLAPLFWGFADLLPLTLLALPAESNTPNPPKRSNKPDDPDNAKQQEPAHA